MFVEKYLMEYSEADRQQAEINKKNAELNLSQKYLVIPYQVFSKLSGNEAIVYAFLTSWESNQPDKRFYFSNNHLAQRFNISENTVSNIMKSLKEKWLVDLKYKKLATWWRIRFVSICSMCQSRDTKIVFRKTQKLGGIIKTVYQEEENIHQNKFDVVFSYFWISKQQIEKWFEHKKSLDRIIYLCEAIEEISSYWWIDPVRNKDTINTTDILLKSFKIEDIKEYCQINDVFELSEDYQELLRCDHYLPYLMDI